MKTRWMIVPMATVIGLSLAFAACGGDDNRSTSSTATASAGTTNTPGETATHNATATAEKTSTPKATPTLAGTNHDLSTPDITECDLVKPDNLGLLANDRFGNGSQVGDACTFTGVAGTIVTIQTLNLGATAKDTFEGVAITFGDDLLSAPGDEAYYDTDLGLAILKGNIELDIYVNDAVDSTRNRASALAVSDVALPNLP